MLMLLSRLLGSVSLARIIVPDCAGLIQRQTRRPIVGTFCTFYNSSYVGT